jgi:hypothetical protein
MSKKQFTLFSVPEEQFRKDIKAKVKQPLRYPKLPRKDPKSTAEVLQLNITVEVDEAFYKKLAANPLLLQKIHDALKAPYAKCCEAIASVYEVANAKVEANLLDPEKATNEAWDGGKEKIKKVVDEMAAITKQKFDEEAKAEKEYAVYKAKIVCTLTLCTVSIVANIALLAATPFTAGASTIIGIIGMAKTTGVMYTEIKNALKEPLQVLEEAYAIYDKLEKDKKVKFKGTKAEKYTRELVNGVANAVLGIQPVKSLSKLKGKLDLADKKILGVNHNLNAMAKKIGVYVDRLTQWEKNKDKPVQGAAPSIGLDAETTELLMQASVKETEKKLAVLLKKHSELLAEFETLKYFAKLLHSFVEVVLEENRNVLRFGEVMEKLGVIYDLGTAGASGAGFEKSVGAIVGIAFSVGPAVADLSVKELADLYEKSGRWREGLHAFS